MTDRVWVRDETRVIVAQICGKSDALDEGARAVKASVTRVALETRDTGNYISKLDIVKVPGERGTGTTVTDRLVVNDDDGAAAIEWGHVARSNGGVITRTGSRRVHWERGTWVPGQYIMTRGMKAVAGG